MRRFAVPFAVLLCLVTSVGMASAAPPVKPTPGAAGSVTRTSPTTGTAGTTSSTTTCDLSYEPSTDVLRGTATITADATQVLSRFDLDLDGLKVRSITVNGAAAKWHRSQGELVITPASRSPNGATFTTVIAYDGVPETDPRRRVRRLDPADRRRRRSSPANRTVPPPGSRPTTTRSTRRPTRSTSASRPASRWSPTAGSSRHDDGSGRTTWTWDADEPMATYLATVDVGDFDVDAYSADGIDFWDAIDPDLFDPIAAPPDGHAVRDLAGGDLSYKRLARTIACPPVAPAVRSTRPRHRVPLGLRLRRDPHGRPGRLDDPAGPQRPHHPGHRVRLPVLARASIRSSTHYQTDGRKGCDPSGTTGDVVGGDRATAATPRTWSIDLGAYAGSDVEVSISYASDDVVQRSGVFDRRHRRDRPAPGSTSFEDDGDTFDGWTVPGAPDGSPGNDNDWIVGDGRGPPADGGRDRGRFARAPAGDHRLPGVELRTVPVRDGGRHRRRRRGPRVRARDADAPGLRP